MASTEGEPQIGEMVVVEIKEEPIMSDEMPQLQNDDPLAGTEHAPLPFKRLRRLPFGLGPHATGNRKIFTCEQCGYRTEYKGSMNRHKLRHSSSKSFVCGLCSYRAYQAQSLKAHMLKHINGQTPPGETLNQNLEKTDVSLWNPSDYLDGVDIIEVEDNKQGLKIQPIVPSKDGLNDGDLKLKVENVDQEVLPEGHDSSISATLTSNSLNSSEEDKKLYGCNMCHYRAHQQLDVKIHKDKMHSTKQIYSDERPYGCGVCDYRALYLTHLQAHMKREHGVNS